MLTNFKYDKMLSLYERIVSDPFLYKYNTVDVAIYWFARCKSIDCRINQVCKNVSETIDLPCDGERLLVADVLSDLHLISEMLCSDLSISKSNIQEVMMTASEAACYLEVSEKTLTRWRRQGLIGRKILDEDSNRVKIFFFIRDLNAFKIIHEEKITRGSKFSLLSDLEKFKIIEKAKKLALAKCSTSDIFQIISNETSRSTETIRNLIRKYDVHNPETPIFPVPLKGMSSELIAQMYADYENGVNINFISKKYYKSVSAISKAIHLYNKVKVAELDLEYVDNELFYAEDASCIILDSDMPEYASTNSIPKLPSELMSVYGKAYEKPLLTKEQECYLFKKYNYLKFLAKECRSSKDIDTFNKQDIQKMIKYAKQIRDTKEIIVEHNLRLVISIAAKCSSASISAFDLVSDGNFSLIRAVERYDISRGNKFSTYATWAIVNNYARSIPKEKKRMEWMQVSSEDIFLNKEEEKKDLLVLERQDEEQEASIAALFSVLNYREERIIRARFGLNASREKVKLHVIGETMGLTRERVRQIEAHALEKMKRAAKKLEE
jgi:RNA polymerase primary sigma factor